jgi:hypothetical protein
MRIIWMRAIDAILITDLFHSPTSFPVAVFVGAVFHHNRPHLLLVFCCRHCAQRVDSTVICRFSSASSATGGWHGWAKPDTVRSLRAGQSDLQIQWNQFAPLSVPKAPLPLSGGTTAARQRKRRKRLSRCLAAVVPRTSPKAPLPLSGGCRPPHVP